MTILGELGGESVNDEEDVALHRDIDNESLASSSSLHRRIIYMAVYVSARMHYAPVL